MTLGERIVYYRKKAGFNQKGLAEALGISATRLNYWEKDKREPDISMINALCRALGVDGDTLLGRLEPEENKKTPSTDESAPGDDLTAEAMQLWGTLREDQKKAVLSLLRSMSAEA